MLYKKVHRQYLRQFRKGRRFKFNKRDDEEHEITREPYIDVYENDYYISVDYDDYYISDIMILIYLTGRKGERRYNIIWLED